jgi:hypothetical protein
VADYFERKGAWEREAGELDYVILWHGDRIVYRPFTPPPAAAKGGAAGAAKSSKEIH